MANTKVSAGTLATSLTATDRWPLAVGSTDRVATPKLMFDYVEASLYPPLVSGSLHYSVLQGVTNTGSGALVVGSYYGTLFRARPGDTFNSVCVEITIVPGGNGNVRIGMYSHDPTIRKPTATAGLIYDSGDVAFTTGAWAASTTPVQIALPAAQTVPDDGHFWILLQVDTAGGLQMRRPTSLYPGQNLLARAINAGALSTTNDTCGLTATGSYGAMPSNPPGTLAVASAIPFMAIYKT